MERTERAQQIENGIRMLVGDFEAVGGKTPAPVDCVYQANIRMSNAGLGWCANIAVDGKVPAGAVEIARIRTRPGDAAVLIYVSKI